MGDYTVESGKKKNKRPYYKNKNKHKGNNKKELLDLVNEELDIANEADGKAAEEGTPKNHAPKKQSQKDNKDNGKKENTEQGQRSNKNKDKKKKDHSEHSHRKNGKKDVPESEEAPKTKEKNPESPEIIFRSSNEYVPDKKAPGFGKHPPFTDFSTEFSPSEALPKGEEPQRELSGETVTVIGVQFRTSSKIYYFDPNGVTYRSDSFAVVDTSRGTEYGYVAEGNKTVPVEDTVPPLRKAIRPATAEDRAHYLENRAKEKEAFDLWNSKITEHNVDMKLIDVEYTFDNTKLLFYFTAEGRVDFRDFVKDLAAVFHCRIELRQMGTRDEAKVLGGLGVCGRPFCCKTHLPDFVQVSIKMAKDQAISLNSAKISGTCGRLMCCLRYEHDVYTEEIRKCPPVGSAVRTPSGEGVVVETKPLTGLIKVKLNSNPDAAPTICHRDDVEVISKAQKGKDEEEKK